MIPLTLVGEFSHPQGTLAVRRSVSPLALVTLAVTRGIYAAAVRLPVQQLTRVARALVSADGTQTGLLEVLPAVVLGHRPHGGRLPLAPLPLVMTTSIVREGSSPMRFPISDLTVIAVAIGRDECGSPFEGTVSEDAGQPILSAVNLPCQSPLT